MPDPDLLLHPVRLRIVQALVGQQLTALQLVQRLGDVPQATVYRHVRALADGGVLEVAEEVAVQGGVERRWTVAGGSAVVGAEALRGTPDEVHQRRFTTFLGTLLGAFTRAVEAAPGDPVDEALGYRVTPLWLDDEELEALVARLREVVGEAFANGPAPGRRRRLLATVLLPDADTPDGEQA